jgi:hypothetical protein
MDETISTKSQIPNSRQITRTNDQNPKQCGVQNLVIGICLGFGSLVLACYLVLVIWNLILH